MTSIFATARQRRFDATMVLDQGRVVDHLGPVAFRFPMTSNGEATVLERYDEEAEVFRVRLEVRTRVVGFLSGHEGGFRCELVPATDAPAELQPVRHERRT